MSTRVLVISPETPGVNMSGTALRYWHLAHALGAELPVTLAVPASGARLSPVVSVVEYERHSGQALHNYLAECEVVIGGGFFIHRYPFLRSLSQPFVVDLYDPFVLENLEIHLAKSLPDQIGIHRFNLGVLTEQLARGDFFVCASEVQRDFWLGMLTATGRLNPQTFGADRTLRRLIEVVPFGVPDEPPVRQRHRLKGVYPGIGDHDLVIYWGGGMWEWLDPLTAVRAMAEIAARRSDVKLFFAGVRHPNPEVPPMRMAEATQRLSQELGLTGRHIFFNDWVPYAERADYLLDADIGLSLHFDHIESHFSYRTRLLDYIWAGLPMVVTRGDILGGLAEARGLARTVRPQDPQAVAQALLALIAELGGRATFADRARALAEDLRWAKAVQPLLEFCRHPYRSADRLAVRTYPALNWDLVPKAWRSLQTRGLMGFLHDVRVYLNGR